MSVRVYVHERVWTEEGKRWDQQQYRSWTVLKDFHCFVLFTSWRTITLPMYKVIGSEDTLCITYKHCVYQIQSPTSDDYVFFQNDALPQRYF